MSAAEYGRALRRYWWLIVITVVLGALISLLYASNTPRTYRSESSILISSNLGSTAQELVQGSNFTQSQIPSYVVLATSPLVLDEAADKLGDGATVANLTPIVSASAALDTAVIEFSVVSRSPDRAREIAEAVTESFTDAVARVAPRSAASPDSASLLTTVIRPATESQAPIGPNVRLFLLIGVAAGAALGVGIALLRGLSGRTVSRSTAGSELDGIPVLGGVPQARRGSTVGRDIVDDSQSQVAESLRSIATNLRYLRPDGVLTSAVISSPSAGESKSTTATGLALVMAESGMKVLLIDGDLRRPTVAEITHLEGAVGLTDVLLDRISLADAVQDWSGVDVLTSGRLPSNPANFLNSAAMRDLIRSAGEHYDFVVVDSAPLLSVADAVALSHATDGLVLVVRSNKTTLRSMRRVIDVLRQSSAPVLGAVIGRVRRSRRSDYGSYYGRPQTSTLARILGRQRPLGPGMLPDEGWLFADGDASSTGSTTPDRRP